MKRFALLLITLQFLVLSAASGAVPAKTCSLCAGVVIQGDTIPFASGGRHIPSLATDITAMGPMWGRMLPEQKRAITLMTTVTLTPGRDPLLQIDEQQKVLVEWARGHGPFAGFGVTVIGADPAMTAYAIKRLAVAAQGQEVAPRIVVGQMPIADLQKLFAAGAQAYFDALLVDAPNVAETARWLAQADPSKKIYAVLKPSSPNLAFDIARALADGASLVYVHNFKPATDFVGMGKDYEFIGNLNAAFTGDWAFDSTAKIDVLDAKGAPLSMPVLSFVRGEDLRTILVPQGDAGASAIVSVPDNRYTHPRRVDANGDAEATDTGHKNGKLLIGVPPVKQPFLLTIDHAEKVNANITKEAIDVATRRGITVEEIIRNHQAYKSFQESIQPKYVARNTTKLRFAIGDGGEVIEAAIGGDYFAEPQGRADWVWQDFYINGVKWKHGRIPELPLIQPEKVTQVPLDIHLTNEYRYHFVRETDLLGYHTYEVRFEPPPNAAASLPLYRGTVWIDAHTWARVRISMVQLNLTGEVLSNEERVDFQPFARDTHAPLTPADVANADPRTLLWLPGLIEAQQVVSAGGRANTVLRSTAFSDFRIDPADFAQRAQQAAASDARMLRETDKGLRYLEKTSSGDRVVKEGFNTSRLFAVAGVHHDAGLEFPVVPLGGVDYFNFNVANTGIQANVFFAGLIIAANATHPNVANTRTNVGADFFAIAVPVTSSMYRNGIERKDEAVKSLPVSLKLRAGHPFLQFGKIDVSLGLSHATYRRADDTAPGFQVPSSTFTISPSIDGQYSRRGYVVSAFYDYGRRTSWKPWGNLAEYDQNQKAFSTFGAAIGKSFYLPKFQRLGLELNYLDGQHLDRFSDYELGFFGAQRVHGFKSGSVRAERALLGHLSYGFVVSDQLRMEAFYDHALVDDSRAGYRQEPFQGVGVGGQTVGPWSTLVRLDVGKSIGRNAQNGFVANVVFLKLF